MNPKVKLVGSFVIVVVLLVGGIIGRIQYEKPKEVIQIPETTKTVSVSIAGKTLVTAVANTNELRTKGLSGTPTLSSDQAMLFVFNEPGLYGFWMVDMKYSIDIIWLDGDKKIVSVKEHATPESYPEVFNPTAPASYVLEVVDGFVSENGVKVGDQLVW